MKTFFKNKKVLVMLIAFVGFLICFNFAAAQFDTGLQTVGEQAGIGATTDVRVAIARIIRTAFGFLGVVAVALVIYGGFLWMTAGGDADKVTKAKKVLVNAFIGLAIILLAFSITSFIINSLQEAVLGQPGEYEYDGGDGGGPSSSSCGFTPKSVQPIGAVSLRNIVVRATFNETLDANLDEQTLKNNFVITDKATGQTVDGAISVNGKILEFEPSAACPEPNQERHCFDADTIYNVQILAGIKNNQGQARSCCLGSVCTAEFSSGNLIDVENPTINIISPYNGQQISENIIFPLQALTHDDSGVSIVEFFVDKNSAGAVSPSEISPNYNAQVDWDNSGFELGLHRIDARVFDLDSNKTDAASKQVKILAEHCFNLSQDFDETGIDCGGADCGVCDGEECDGDLDCASGVCVDSVCVNYPTITALSNVEGAIGNMITIWGYNFGEYQSGASKVEFTGPKQSLISAEFSCGAEGSTWSEHSVVVKVPEGSVDGPIKLTNVDGYWDNTANDRGFLGDFVINPDLFWPGLCSVVNPDGRALGEYEDSVLATGENMGQSGEVLFGNIKAQVTGAWSSNSISGIKVPNVSPSNILVNVKTDGQLSNPVNFQVVSSSKLPEIISVNPETGGIGQYTTISGRNFGDNPNLYQVYFINKSNDSIRVPADLNFPPECAESLWSDTEVLVKVPQTNLLGEYSVQMIGQEAQSNKVNFLISDASASPGICGLDPDNGPVGTSVNVYGEGFRSEGVLTFNENKKAQQLNLTANLIATGVPPASVSGPVNFALENLISNGMVFNVGSCTSVSCDAGDECCVDGVCRLSGACETSLIAAKCEYSWMLSTDKLPLVPRVLETMSCDDEHNQSPSPWKDSSDACVNALISAQFNMPVKMDAIADKLIIKRCSLQNEVCDFNKCGQEGSNCVFEIPSSIETAGSLSDRFAAIVESLPGGGDESNLISNTWHQVTIKGGVSGIRGENDTPMPVNYVWQFKTKDGPCEPVNVIVEPTAGIISEYLGQLNYTVYGQAENCNILKTGFDWSWVIDRNQDKASIEDISNDKSQVTGLAETEPADPVVVRASTVSVDGVTQQDSAPLKIDFTDPKVKSFGPNCQAACVNTAVFSTFNTYMNADSVKKNFQIFKCQGQQCLGLTAISPNNFTFEYNDLDKTLWVFGQAGKTPYYFSPNSYYRVVIGSRSESLSGVELTGLNFDRNDDGKNDAFSWTFKTKNDNTRCDLETAVVNPDFYESTTQGEKVQYLVSAKGTPDECNPSGQTLNPFEFDWVWSVLNPGSWVVASITHALHSTDFPSEICSSNCLNLGSDPFAAVCGNGAQEYGEECDNQGVCSGDEGTDCSSNADCSIVGGVCEPKDGDGCSIDCLNESVPAVSDGGSCGNGVREGTRIIDGITYHEECDPAVDPDICTAGCQLAGSDVSGFVCGNGQKEAGEDCDDGNASNGDGCSNICLFEGSKYSVAQIIETPLCGNADVEPGEDCDDGNLLSGDGCSPRCLAEGNAEQCGNGIINIGENCDDGNNDSGDGCSAVCLAEGSDWDIGSYCGNGFPLEVGETCEAKQSSDFQGSPKQLVTVDGNIDPFIMSESAEIKAMTDNFAGTRVSGSGELAFTRTFCESVPVESPYPIVGPTGSDVCRNSAIQIKLNQQIKQSSLSSGISVTYDCGQTSLLSKIKKLVIKKIKYRLEILAVAKIKVKNYFVKPANAQRKGEEETFTQTTFESVVLDYHRPDNSNVWLLVRFGSSLVLATVNKDSVSPEVWTVAEKYAETGSIVLISGLLSNTPDSKGYLPMAVDNLQIIEAEEPPALGSSGVCKLSIKKISVVYNEELRESSITIFPDGLLAPNTKYTVDFSGLQDHCGESISGDIFEFTTGPEAKICKMDYVEITPDYQVVSKRFGDAEYAPVDFQANAGSYELANSSLNPVPGVYAWDWTWNMNSEPGGLDVSLFDKAGDATGANPEDDDQKSLQTGVSNGEVEVDAIATVTDSEFGDLDKEFGGAANVIIYLCENIWTGTLTDGGFWRDSDFAFRTFYCRDAGNPGETDDLPNLKIVQAPPLDIPTDAWSQDDSAVLREYFMLREDNLTPDAIAMRIYTNPEGVSPAIWYDLHVPNPGSTQNISIDCSTEYNNNAKACYPGIQDGRTVYLSAANQITVYVNYGCYFIHGKQYCRTLAVGDSIYHNIYVLSYSENANPETLSIYSQLLNNLKFNYFDSSMVKASLKRDTQRMHDIVFIRSLIKNYIQKNGRLPLLDETGSYVPGTYVNGQSISAWPSWTTVLSNLLGSPLPIDPQNGFNGTCPANYDQDTCFNEQLDEKFYNEYDKSVAQVYDYSLDPDSPSGYNLSVNFETVVPEAKRYPAICVNLQEIDCH
ncbi:MAG TPA: IPT/TIG domain-containing protein [Candidatus Bipolaricaulota bacterium]|nr:IPT/TIG domain-containing protein [Candidatus Bipolaricaulota bacterium]